MRRVDAAPENPPANGLRPGLTAADVLKAIRASGYPLQTLVGADLRREGFIVQDEWSFRDRETGQSRALDLLAKRQLAYLPSEESRIRPWLALLVECKQSELPYVFFESSPSVPAEVVRIAGLKSDSIKIKTDDDRSTWTYPVLHCLGLRTHSFIANAPVGASTFSKCVRKGSEIVLSGSEVYNSVLLPLMSAVEHYVQAAEPLRTAFWFDAALIIGVAVLDAPMVSVSVSPNDTLTRLTPWVRVHRHEAHTDESGKLYALDFVHKSYFNTYVRDHVTPFARAFEELALRHHHELASGRAFVPGMGANFYIDVEERLQPRKIELGPPLRVPRKLRPASDEPG